ncbi:Protein PLANT CADMIUM RESISTANCE 3 [Pseudocercospora fuligena]|uniref:Protein PLANT CADMIUM RESISTANCE 3 n=1 Tax=Pseudocercospora fuligena TaxID=685502 RepID=A0A8H6RI36_9PEZI|nr:Protein PLANT CADMIUM RESISTANCE 3 [Pseudocercospora fuligena]
MHEEEWMNNICGGCCGAENCRSCLLSWFLPCFMFGRVSDRFERADKHDEKPSTLNKHCLEYEMARRLCLGPCAVFLLRRHMRKDFGIKGNGFTDALASLCCRPCTLGQMEREAKHRKGHPKPTQRVVTTPYAPDSSHTMAYTPADHPAAVPAPASVAAAPVNAEKAPIADPALAKDPTKAPVAHDLADKEKIAPPSVAAAPAPTSAEKTPVPDPAHAKDPTKAPAADDLASKEKVAPPLVAHDPAEAAPKPPLETAPPVDAEAPVRPPLPAEKVPDDAVKPPPLPVQQLTKSDLVEPPPAAAHV